MPDYTVVIGAKVSVTRTITIKTARNEEELRAKLKPFIVNGFDMDGFTVTDEDVQMKILSIFEPTPINEQRLAILNAQAETWTADEEVPEEQEEDDN